MALSLHVGRQSLLYTTLAGCNIRLSMILAGPRQCCSSLSGGLTMLSTNHDIRTNEIITIGKTEQYKDFYLIVPPCDESLKVLKVLTLVLPEPPIYIVVSKASTFYFFQVTPKHTAQEHLTLCYVTPTQ